ncbi:unnamed protein product [Chironomus riparius]|uniref:C-type lectin domain-containing protein n=1 Tax=Chironomus riparius TaxID=315576 RepID=A0A9N9RVT1_9DIPT|nr:unnamed protein product [Chironomus riparius]
MNMIHIFYVLLITPTFGIYVQNELKNVTKRNNYSPAEWTEPEGIWSSLLEEWTLSNREIPSRGREARIIQTVPPPNFYGQQQQHQFQQPYHKYIPTSETYLNRRIGESVEPEPNLRRQNEAIAGKVVANMMGPPSMQHQQQQQQQQQQIPLKLQSQHRQYQFNSPREVSETDLYLLGAIEKLVYRVDYMEKRLKRTEQLVYYLMAGNNQKVEPDECPKNFTKINTDCYHIGAKDRVDWKSAALKCKSLGAILAEFEKIEKYQDVVAHVLSNQDLRGHDFWIGGLNPGLLWIWSTSARPVNPNANITSITNKNEAVTKIPAKVLNASNSTKAELPTISSNFPEISGNGRCLRLSYNPSLFSYGYTGHDCSTKHYFMCVIHDKSLDNEINRIAKELKFDIE